MRILVLPILLFVSACGAPLSAQRPIVDLAGKNPAQANRDMAACEHEAMNSFVTVGNPTTRCMRTKGYAILSPTSRID